MPLEAVPAHRLKGILSLELHPLLEVPDDMKTEPDHEQTLKCGFYRIARRSVILFGGPAQYLNGRITTSEARASFESLLRNLVPSSDLVD